VANLIDEKSPEEFRCKYAAAGKILRDAMHFQVKWCVT